MGKRAAIAAARPEAGMLERIGVGVDGSDSSRAALAWAIDRRDAAPILLHAAADAADTAGRANVLAASEAAFARSIDPARDYPLEVHVGDHVRVLAAQSHRFDLLAIGTHKTGFLRGRAFGSSGVRLATESSCPVAVIPGRSGRERGGVVVGIDDLSRSRSAVMLGCLEAVRTGAELTLIHPHSEPAEPAFVELLRDVRGDFPGLTVRTRTVSGNLAETLVNTAASAAMLLVGGAMPGQASLAALCHDVLLNISGPTILVPVDWTLSAASR